MPAFAGSDEYPFSRTTSRSVPEHRDRRARDLEEQDDQHGERDHERQEQHEPEGDPRDVAPLPARDRRTSASIAPRASRSRVAISTASGPGGRSARTAGSGRGSTGTAGGRRRTGWSTRDPTPDLVRAGGERRDRRGHRLPSLERVQREAASRPCRPRRSPRSSSRRSRGRLPRISAAVIPETAAGNDDPEARRSAAWRRARTRPRAASCGTACIASSATEATSGVTRNPTAMPGGQEVEESARRFRRAAGRGRG